MVNRFRNLPRIAKIGIVAMAGIIIIGCCLCPFIFSQSNKATQIGVTPAATDVPAMTSTSAPAATSTPAEARPSVAAPSSSPTPGRPTQPPTVAPTMTARPAAIPTKPAPTVAPKVVPTAAPTNAPPIATQVAPCNCSVEDYDCKDFRTQREAQMCFDYCGGSKTNNVFRLDGNDHDGKVCESLP